MNASTTIAHAENATHESIAGEAVIIDLNSGVYYSLNKVGTEFWEMMDGERSIGSIARDIAAKYDVEVEMVTRDLLEVAAKLSAENLVVTIRD